MAGNRFVPLTMPAAGRRLKRAIQDRLSIVELIDELHPEAITPEEMVGIGLSEAEFVNVNTPEEWTRLSQTRGRTAMSHPLHGS